MKILFITTIPSPYRVSFFNELGKVSDLTVLFEKSVSDERDDSWSKYRFDNFKGIILKGKAVSVNTAFCPSIVKYLNKKWDRIIVCNISTPTGMLAIQYMKMHHISYWIEGDGGFAKSGKGLKEMIKRHFIKNADGYFSTSAAHDGYYKTYGANQDRIHRYPFTSLYYNDIIKEKTISDSFSRNQLGFREERIIISVGRFSYQNGYGKGYDTLLKVARILGDQYGFYIIGDKPTEEFVSLAKSYELGNIHFVDFMPKKELFKHYQAADVFVLLTRGEAWGLVINEAMACGLPIITTDKCIAGLELVENGVNGYIVPVNAPKQTAQKIKECFLDDNLVSYGKNSIAKIQDYTFEKMAERHMEVLSNGKD